MTTTEQDRAQMEAERNAAEDEYFAARPFCNYEANRMKYSAGYERGWNERNKKVMELQAEMMSISVDYEKEIISLKDNLFNRT